MKKMLTIIIIAIILSSSIVIYYGFEQGMDGKVKFVLAADSEDGYATIYKPRNRDLVILQLTDIHLEYFLMATESLWNSYGICGNNESTLQMIEQMIVELKPDLVVISGDALRSWLHDNLEIYARIAEIMERLEVLWMPVYGNHEFEYAFEKNQHTPERLTEELMKYPHCLISKGDCDDGVANYFVNIRDIDNNIIYTLSAIDCVFDKKYDTGGIAEGWSYIRTEAQIEWYERHIKAISALQYGDISIGVVPSMVFVHTPVPEALLAWEEAWNEGSPTEKYHYGRLLTGKSTYIKYLGEDKLFDKAVELGSTKAIFSGHHHDNDFSVDYQGIRLTAGQMTTNNLDYRIGSTLKGIRYTAFSFERLFTYGDNRGATQINISDSSTFTITPKYAREVLKNYHQFEIDYDAAIQKLISMGIEVKR